MKTEEIKEKLQRAYQAMVDTIEPLVEKEGKTLREAVETAEEKISEWEELSKEEVQEISAELKKDLRAMGETLEGAKEAYKEQLKMDAAYLTDSILEKFNKIADTPTAQFLLFKEQIEEEAREATFDEHLKEHQEHQNWHSEHQLWLDEIALWKQDHESALQKLHEIESALKKHSEELQEHEQVIKAHEAQDREHEEIIANVEQDPTSQVFEANDEREAKIHQKEKDVHAEHAELHQNMKKHHLHMMALVNKLYEEVVENY